MKHGGYEGVQREYGWYQVAIIEDAIERELKIHEKIGFSNGHERIFQVLSHCSMP